MKIYERFGSREIVEAMNKVGAAKFESFDDYRDRYGLTDITEIAVLFEGIGVLLEPNLIDKTWLISSSVQPSICCGTG